ncbi:hypothetical protein RJ639_038132 [Escallonia herrerae]|uniref:Cytochrome P450 n=1 Tax=Escallonia herrerae TaxID=1293975 RepID=A0AA88WMF1_9ASTE|nr:hypothetical protein RJ639_038132 [Escallonia herrerae]
MDTLVYLVPLVLLPLSLSFFFFFGKSNPSSSKNPPGTSGWPMVGENIDFALAGPQKFVYDRMKKYSPDVFQTSLLGEKMAVFCGATGNKFLFTNENKLLTSWWPQSMKKALLFPDFVEDSLKEVSALKRSFLHDILKPEALKQYIPLMDSMARDHLEADWSPHEEVKVFPMLKKYTFALACKLFMSVDDPEHVARLAKHFTLVTSGMFSVPIDLPGTAYNRAIKGGKLVRDELLKIIRDRKKEMIENKETAGRDLLSRMLLVTDENGEFMSEMEISNNIIGLLVASYETTSTAVTFVLKYLAELPHVYDEVYRGTAKTQVLTRKSVFHLSTCSGQQRKYDKDDTEHLLGSIVPSGMEIKNTKEKANVKEDNTSRQKRSHSMALTLLNFGREYASMNFILVALNLDA